MSMPEHALEKESCQLESRHWIITDENGLEERVDGRGVVGEASSLLPPLRFLKAARNELSTLASEMHIDFSLRSQTNSKKKGWAANEEGENATEPCLRGVVKKTSERNLKVP